jgi:hypothetical protein
MECDETIPYQKAIPTFCREEEQNEEVPQKNYSILQYVEQSGSFELME